MKYFELDKEEKDILKNFDEGNFESVAAKEHNKYIDYAKSTLNKQRNINIRLSEKDLSKVKTKAIKKGMPYQTLVTSIIHQYANDEIGVKI